MSYLQYQYSPEQIKSYEYTYLENGRSQSTDDEPQFDQFMPKVVKTDICKYKTQMCKNFAENGFCPYRKKCQFAHGIHQMSTPNNTPKKAYRTRKCKSFWDEGVCRYGPRCQFSHYQIKNEGEKNFIGLMGSMLGSDSSRGFSKLNRILQKPEQ